MVDVQGLRIRPMSLQDLDEVMRIETTIYPFPWTRGNFNDSLRAGYDCWRFEDGDGHLIGYAVAMWAPDEVHLLNLSLDLPAQGRRLGEYCLRWLADDVHRRGAPALLLEVRPSNHRALRLYERVGMQQIGVRRGYYPYFDGQREDALVMRCALPIPRLPASRSGLSGTASEAAAPGARADAERAASPPARQPADAGGSATC